MHLTVYKTIFDLVDRIAIRTTTASMNSSASRGTSTKKSLAVLDLAELPSITASSLMGRSSTQQRLCRSQRQALILFMNCKLLLTMEPSLLVFAKAIVIQTSEYI